MGSDLPPDVRSEASNEIRDQYLDASKARTVLGWSPAFTFDASLRTTVAWYRAHFAALTGVSELQGRRG
jgi:CDP-glucose 4,6-dehydratase